MRVLAFCDYFGAPSSGGAERVAEEVYRRLAGADGVEISVVGGVPGHPPAPPRPGTDHLEVLSAPALDLTSLLGAQLVASKGLSALARSAHGLRPAQVVHVNGVHFQSSLSGARFARRHRLPLVVTAHLAGLAHMPGRARWPAVAFDRVASRRVCGRAHRVLAVSAPVADHLVGLGTPPEKVSVAPNGVDHRRFAPVPRGEPAPWLEVVAVGRLTVNKAPLLALEAVARARSAGRDVRIKVVGDGPLLAQVRRRAAAPDLAGWAEVVGHSSKVEEWLGKADVALRPSFTEGHPLGVLEALACGVPVVCTDVAGNLEAVHHQVNGLVVGVGDVVGMSEALVHLHDDRPLVARMGAAASQSAAGFTWERSAAAHLEAFESALAVGA